MVETQDLLDKMKFCHTGSTCFFVGDECFELPTCYLSSGPTILFVEKTRQSDQKPPNQPSFVGPITKIYSGRIALCDVGPVVNYQNLGHTEYSVFCQS